MELLSPGAGSRIAFGVEPLLDPLSHSLVEEEIICPALLPQIVLQPFDLLARIIEHQNIGLGDSVFLAQELDELIHAQLFDAREADRFLTALGVVSYIKKSVLTRFCGLDEIARALANR